MVVNSIATTHAMEREVLSELPVEPAEFIENRGRTVENSRLLMLAQRTQGKEGSLKRTFEEVLVSVTLEPCAGEGSQGGVLDVPLFPLPLFFSPSLFVLCVPVC